MNRTTWASALTLAACLAVPAGAADAASPRPSSATMPPPDDAVVRRVDVDGDARRDTVRLTRIGGGEEVTFRLSVDTAGGRRVTRDVRVTDYTGALTTADVWAGTAHLDGARGAEIRLEQGGGIGDAPWPHVYTWRSGRLVPAAAPGRRAAYGWDVSDQLTAVSGYRFATTRAGRHVTVTDLHGRFDAARETVQFTGTRTTYRWRAGRWVPASTTRIGRLDETRARDAAGWHGVDWAL